MINTAFMETLADGQAKEWGPIARKVLRSERIGPEEGLQLYSAPLGLLAWLAEFQNERQQQRKVYYIRTFHLEPTNTCAYHCRFCSYSGVDGVRESWELTEADIRQQIEGADPQAAEIHITGGAHPHWRLADYVRLLKQVRSLRPAIHIKAFSAVEIHHLHLRSGRSYSDILTSLQAAGLDSLPGGGAEIFDPDVRNQICPEKANAEQWLAVHHAAHQLGIPSNATMLYGHIESYEHRIHHMQALRTLQDETHGFNAFIPLKFRSANNKMSQLGEVAVVEDLRNYALGRIYLDNFPHLKAYWPMLGKETAALALEFGVDDLDGTIQDSTKIYSMAGVEERPRMTAEQMVQLIRRSGKIPVERDAYYAQIQP